jgi:hypothetical protein
MKQEDISTSEKIEILRHIHLMQRDEIMYRRDREFKVFTWCSSILFALIGALLITKQSEAIVWESYGFLGKTIASMAVIALVIFSIKWQNTQKNFARKNARVIANINKLLYCFEDAIFSPQEGESILPKEWADWGKSKPKSSTRLFQSNKITATALLGVFAVLMIWIP